MRVPLLDLKAQYRSISEEVRQAINPIIEDQSFVLGPAVERFEREVSEFLGVAHAVGCASGTDALLLSLKALDIGPDDEVVTSPFTLFATGGAIHNVGARPVFADIDEKTFNLDPAAAEAAVGERTRAIMPVHLFGQMADMEAFRDLGARREVPVVEDAAQAIGARRRRCDGGTITTGTLGDMCGFSFFPSKNLGGFGDGGMIVTNDSRHAERLARLRVHGGRTTYHHEEVGFNSRLDALQAAVLSAKLPHLPAWSEGRRRNAAFYTGALGDVGEIVLPYVSPENESIYNQYTIRVRDGQRDALQAALREREIGTAIYYPVPLHLQECFAYLGIKRGSLPNSERAAAEVLSLPIYPELSEAQLQYVAEAIREFFAG